MKRSGLSLFARSILCSLLPAVFFVAAALAADNAPAPPVRKVVLYKHGMGYVERRGPVDDDATVGLSFRPDQMKDLMATFFAVDLGGGVVSEVRYDAKDPLSRQLQDIPISVPEEAALSRFLARLQGAGITARAGGETIEGRILGYEPVVETVNANTITRGYRLVVLTTAGPIRSLDMFALAEFSLTDPVLQRDLARYLDVVLSGKQSSRKRLAVTSRGKGKRDLLIGYLVEMPVWKASYRLLIDPDAGKPALLQGWAQAENVTEEDWREVSVSFVAGSPLSFSMDLYAPLYVRRPEVPVPGLSHVNVDWGKAAPPEAAARGEEAPVGRTRADASGRYKAAEMRSVQMMDRAYAAAPAAAAPPVETQAPPADAVLASALGEGQAEGARVGELFSYEVRQKVSIPRGQAALIPILSRKVEGKRVAYYKAVFSPRAVNAWVLRNDSDLTFDAGPVTVFQGSTSLGEGILSHTLPPGSQEVIPYAVDASLDVTPQVKSEARPYVRGRIADSLLHLTRTESLLTSWKLGNRGKEKATLWLDQPKNMAYRLSKPEKPLKEVADHYRFELPLGPGETKDFAVEEIREVSETVALTGAGADVLRFHASGKHLSQKTRAFLAELAGLAGERAALQRQTEEMNRNVQRLSEEEERLRRNAGTAHTGNPKEQELRAKWMGQLAAAEDRIVELRRKLDEAGTKVRGLDDDMARRLRDYREE